MCRAGLCGGGGEGEEGSGAGGARGRRSNTHSGSGSQYALCALGVGLVALGVVMIIWTIVPFDAGNSTHTPSPASGSDDQDEETESKTKTSSVAFVLVGSGVVMLLLAICLGLRNRKRLQRRATEQGVGRQYMDRVPGEESDEPAPDYGVPSYEEAVGSGQYPIRQSNLRNSTTHLPSYEDLIAAVENETADGPVPGPSETPAAGDPPTQPDGGDPPAAAPTPAPAAAPAPANPPQRSASRASRLLRPLRVRRIKSDKLHLKDFRLNIRNPQPGSITIEPITPPPMYDDKAPELPLENTECDKAPELPEN
ncbi:transmembrane protein 51b [Engraulis encrasicolus]|uniref:transmembrane protein 51b n=1 Tax=Engraulis encrasicolus TaxID=184585 RepID=UPI002FCFB4DA